MRGVWIVLLDGEEGLFLRVGFVEEGVVEVEEEGRDVRRHGE